MKTLNVFSGAKVPPPVHWLRTIRHSATILVPAPQNISKSSTSVSQVSSVEI